MRLAEAIEFLRVEGVTMSSSSVSRLLHRGAGSGNWQDYRVPDLRYVIMYHRWQELTGNMYQNGRHEARTAASMARNRNSGWIVKCRGTMYWTKTPWHYARYGVAAVRVPE